MGLEIKGEFTAEEIEFVENRGPKDFYTSVITPEVAEKYNEEPAAYYERGDEAFINAISLLRLIDLERANRLDTIRQEIVRPENAIEQAIYMITLENVKKIYELVKDMTNEMPQFYDDNYFLLPKYKEAVEKIDRTLYHVTMQGDKMIDLSTGQVEQLIKFLELAIKKQRDVWLSY